MAAKTKGSNAERELVSLFWKHGFAAVRVAGSGSARFPNPDVLAGNGYRRLAIECKAIRSDKIYLNEGDLKQIKDFSSIFGAESWFGVRFDNLKWKFILLEDIEKTLGGYVISLANINKKGLSFDELIGKF